MTRQFLLDRSKRIGFCWLENFLCHKFEVFRVLIYLTTFKMSCCSNQANECMSFEVRKACADDIPCIHGMIQVILPP